MGLKKTRDSINDKNDFVDTINDEVVMSFDSSQNILAGRGASGATITVGSESTNVINVAIQLTDANGDDLAVRASVFAYLSDDANGDSVAGTAPSGGVAVGTDGVAIPVVAGKAFQLISEADGDIDLDITETGADTWYLVLVRPIDGRLIASGAITFAA